MLKPSSQTVQSNHAPPPPQVNPIQRLLFGTAAAVGSGVTGRVVVPLLTGPRLFVEGDDDDN